MSLLLPYVNPLQGTNSFYHYSNGNTLPLVALPFGMASWSPQTNEEGGGWFFHPSHRHFQGLRLTHQPSPWIGDYGQVVLMPQTGKLCLSASERASSFLPREMMIKPDYFNIKLLRDHTTLELSPTQRCSYARMRFERFDAPRLILSFFEGETAIKLDSKNRRVTGYTRANKGGAPDNFAMYFVYEFDCEIDQPNSGIYDRNYNRMNLQEATGDGLGIFVGLSPDTKGTVAVRIGTSFISIAQAQRNLEREIGSKSFDMVRKDAAQSWEAILGRIRIEEEDLEQLKTFYTCLYRTCLFPRIWYEYDELDNQIHYSPYNGRIENGPMYSDHGFWDTFRTVYPLFSILFPSRLNEIMQSWVNVYKESGWMPKWISPGERSTMPGTLIDAAFADAYGKGVRDYDIASAYEGIRKHATQASSNPFYGRKGLDDYNRLGYVPCDGYDESVNNSLDYVYGDFCIAQIAKELGKKEDYRMFMKRAGNYRKLLRAENGFMQGRKEDGKWKEPFNPIAWGGDYCEGSAWQCSWAVQHDLLGLAEEMGGKEVLKARLDELMTMPPVFDVGSYPGEIHEMSEMAAAELGQFAISNQPSFHIPYIYTAIGYPDRTQYWVRKTLEEMFSSEEDGLPGDEDNGSLCAWYLFGAMGIYPLCPGIPEYVLGSPLLKKMMINLEDGKSLTITADDSDTNNKYVNRIMVNGIEYEKLSISHSQLITGGNIHFCMTDIPSDKEYKDNELPFSMSKESKDESL